jgi:hypothetical protein
VSRPPDPLVAALADRYRIERIPAKAVRRVKEFSA